MNIEIPDEELKEAVQAAVRKAARDAAASYSVSSYIELAVRERIKGVADAMVLEAIKDAPAIKAKIAAEVESRLRKQVAAALKAAA